MKKGKAVIILVILVLIVVLVYVLVKMPKGGGNGEINENESEVIRVIDGDTFELESGEIVRMICIDAPEKGGDGEVGEEASQYLEGLILNKIVRLEKDVSEKDAYGRLLRYVYIEENLGEGIFVNKIMVEKGYAEVFRYGNDTKRCDEIEGI